MGAGGEFWFKSTQKQYGSCETVTCRFHGTWLYAFLIRVQDTPSTWHYVMSGRLMGKYHDATHKNEAATVNFIQPTVESKYPLTPINDGNNPQTVGMGSLEIVGTSQ